MTRGTWSTGCGFVLICLAGCGPAKSAEAPESAVESTDESPDTAAPESPLDATSTGEPEEPAQDEGGEQSAAPPTVSGGAPTSKPDPQAATTDKTLSGKLSQAEILALVTKHNKLFDECYTLGAAGTEQFVATVTVKATISPSGKVAVAEVTKSTAKNPKVDACVADAFKKMPFPAPADGATSVITFPMKFEGAEEIK